MHCSLRAFLLAAGLLPAATALPALAQGIESSSGGAPEFDIVRAHVASEGDAVVFRMSVSGAAGSSKPTPSGQVAGSSVFSYVWPTSIDSGQVGFESGQGILALAVTAHPDFDDTPREDEDGNARADDDGGLWHSHWVVLVEDDACGPGALKVRDIPEGAKPKLPETWPGLPILIDSPGYPPAIGDSVVEVRVPGAAIGAARGASYDAVTAALRVNADMHAPLLCVVDVFDVASGDLSLPGRIE